MKFKLLFLNTLALVMCLSSSLGAVGQEAYACYTPSNTTLTFYYDTQRSSREGTIYGLNYTFPLWYEDSTCISVTHVVFDPAFKDYGPYHCAYWFKNMKNLQSITGLTNLNTINVSDMSCMFQYCASLTSLDLSGFNTAKVTRMASMFDGCSSLTSLDLSSFKTSKVYSMLNMFRDCHNLTSINLSSFNTRDLESMSGMFENCYSLTSLDISGFDTGKVSGMSHLFHNCRSLTDLNISNISTLRVTSMSYMFASCHSLTKLDLSHFITLNTTGCASMFEDTRSLQEVILGSYFTRLGENAFAGATALTKVTCWATTPPEIASNSFDNSHYSNVALNVPTGSKSDYQTADYWKNFTNVVEMNYDFEQDGIYYKVSENDITVTVSNRDNNYHSYSGDVVIPATVTIYGVTYTVTKVGNVAFFNCPDVTSVTIPETVTAIGNTTFKWCTSLTSIVIPNSVTSIGLYAFEECTALKDVTLGSNVASIGQYAFRGCTALESGQIICLGYNPPTAWANTFDHLHYMGTSVYVPRDRYRDYAQAEVWRDFAELYEYISLDEALNIEGGNIHFTTGDDASLNNYPWKTTSSGNRLYAYSGNAGKPSSESMLTANVTLTEASTLSFDFMAMGEGASNTRVYDACIFQINGVEQFCYGEDYWQDWTTFTIDLAAGTHTLTWLYIKDESVDPDGDHFAVDNVAITPKQTARRGDVNGDDNVTISDVTALIDILLSGTPAPQSADCNQDTNVTISDVTALIDYLLSGNW